MTTPRLAATLSIDLDDLWAYRRSFGMDEGDGASLLPTAVPRFITFMQRHGISGSAFVVGRDAALPAVKPLLRALQAAGHEIGNHSFEHAGDIEAWPAERQTADLRRAHDLIADATGGHAPQGFRAPSFRLSPTLLRSVAAVGYRYDSSSFPSSLAALARRWQQRRARALGQAVDLPSDAHGGASRGQPLSPYRWDLGAGPGAAPLIEVPVTTLPALRLPLHGTYLQHLADTSPLAARSYARLSMAACAAAGVAPHLLLHATDFIGADDGLPTAFLPGMRRGHRDKLALLDVAVGALRARFDAMPLIRYVQQLPASLPLRTPMPS